jgi:Family of unknown function (DUF5709)
MRQDESYPAPVSDPTNTGIPEYADDDSTAYDDVDSPRVADGPDPWPLPRDRDDGPMGLDDVATTPEGQRRGPSLDDRLAEEEPEVGEDDLPTPGSALADEATTEAQEETEGRDVEVLDGDATQWPDPDSPVSSYDREGLDPLEEGRVGRLVEPDEGAHPDVEADEVARDYGASKGGAGPEELAMHEIPDRDRG